MSNSYTIKRYSLIIDKISKGKFPTLQQLLHYLDNHDCTVSSRTFQRILEDIRDVLGVDIQYDHRHKGYFISNESHDLTRKFLSLLEIARSAESFSRSIQESRANLDNIHIGSSPGQQGLFQIPDILKAIREQRAIAFLHHNYYNQTQKEVALEPLLVKEYEDRWYVYGRSIKINEYRTYGIDRMEGLQLTNLSFEKDASIEPQQLFDEIIGVSMTHNPLTKVVLEFSAFQANYIKSLPWHHSQTILQEDDEHCIMQFTLKPNYELIQKILMMGDEVKVIAPLSLVHDIRERLLLVLGKYEG